MTFECGEGGVSEGTRMLQVEVHVCQVEVVLDLLLLEQLYLLRVVGGVVRGVELHTLRDHEEVEEVG